jgi:hypothetical protein
VLPIISDIEMNAEIPWRVYIGYSILHLPSEIIRMTNIKKEIEYKSVG